MNINVQFNSLDEMVEFAKQLAPLNGASTIFAPTAKAKEPAAAPTPAKPVNSPAKKEEPQKAVETPETIDALGFVTKAEAAPAPAPEKKEGPTLVQLRALLAGINQKTKKNYALAIMKKFGYESLTEIPAEKYGEIYTYAEDIQKKVAADA